MRNVRGGSQRVLAVFILAAGLVPVGARAAQRGVQGTDAAPLHPPVAPVKPVTEDYYGTKVVDPYRYMENLKDPKVEAWFKGQNAYTRAQLAKIPGRNALLARIRELDTSTPAKVSAVNRVPGGRYFYEKELANEIVARLYVRDGLEGQERVLVDPNKYPAPAGSHNVISYYVPSLDGKSVAVGISAGGSENATIHIFDVDTGKESPETIDRAQFGNVQWRADGRSFFYNRMQELKPGQPETDKEEKSTDYLHVVGTNPDKDVAVLGYGLSPQARIEALDIPFVAIPVDSKWALALVVHGVLPEVTLYEAPASEVDKADVPWVKICDVSDDVTNFDAHGDDLYLLSHKDAPRFKVLRTSLEHPDVAHAEVVVPEAEGNTVVKAVSAAEDGLYVQSTDGTVGLLERVPYGGGHPEAVKLPFEGTVAVASSDPRIAGVLLELTSWARAPRIDAYDPQAGAVTDTKLQPLGPNDDPEDVVSEEVKVKSWDGVEVPLSIVHMRGLKMDGENPTLLRSYGAYGITIPPNFDPTLLAWLEKGAVYAWCHPRGGGVYGEDWHKWGEKLTKPNTWRDTIACAEYLIDHKYTSSAKLAGSGTSAGGVTIGRAFTERPDLFAAALDRVGMSNAVRSEDTPNGPPNIPEFGTVKTQYGFEDLYTMDAYHHVRKGVKYPAILLTTGWNDPRVASWEPGKMTAQLQAATGSGKPILLRVDYAAGHGIGSTKVSNEEDMADEWSFLLWQLRVKGFQP
ncbi:MAG TPA: prolyl oligopeptidase family serine peptidase [Acidobacteriaceae bacterium]|jgi:prolyl oligopeptidase|nr:prolyl oligopeptidase family serine peptidase [Acidobacteriaceae bacterium]